MTGVIRRGVLTPFLGLVILVGMTGCGPTNGGDVAADAYAGTVCSGLLAWRQGVNNDSAQLSRALQAGASDVSTVKAKYTAFFRGVVRRTDVLLTAVDRAGAPKVDNGVLYARDLRTALAQARAGLATAQRRFAGLPTNNLRSYATGAAKARDELGTVLVGVGAALERLGQTYPDKRLNKAFDQQPNCKGLA